MKSIYAAIIAWCMLVTSCSSDRETPETVVKNYLAAVDKFDYEATRQLMVDNDTTRRLIQSMKLYEQQMTFAAKDEYLKKQKNYDIDPASVDQNNARVQVNYTEDEIPVVIVFTLRKTNNGWRISNMSANF
jgi:hypothetical protein